MRMPKDEPLPIKIKQAEAVLLVTRAWVKESQDQLNEKKQTIKIFAAEVKKMKAQAKNEKAK